jgi:hypothetical protein
MRLLARREIATVGGKFTSKWTCSASPLTSRSLATKAAHTFRMICSLRPQSGWSRGPGAGIW